MADGSKDTQPLLELDGLRTYFFTDIGTARSVDGVSYQINPGETLGVVGESGCGKSVTALSIMGLIPQPPGRIVEGAIRFRGRDLTKLSDRELREIRGNEIAMIFQEPMTSLNPVFTIGWQLDEALKYHTKLNKKERRARAVEMLRLVEIPNPEQRYKEYPHQLSGGMRQRVMIAIALCCEPDILIADEPTTALDVTIQAQILALMADLKTRLGTSILLITHDLGVVAQVCDRVIVMYAGRIIEKATVSDLFKRPQHPYTKALLESIPKAGQKTPDGRLPTIKGIVPSLFDLPKGCRFQDRCPYKEQKCVDIEPDLVPHAFPDRPVRCHFPRNQDVELTTGVTG